MSRRTVKKLRVQQKVALDGAVRAIANHPEIGKNQGWSSVWHADLQVLHGKFVNLLARRVLDEDTLKLLRIGSHKNLYHDLKRTDI